MDAAMQALTDAAAENTTVTASAAAVIQGPGDRPGEVADDQEAVLQAAHGPADCGRGRRREGAFDRPPAPLGRHFPAAAPRCFRYSSR